MRAAIEETKRELARARLDRDHPLPQPLEELTYNAPDPALLQERYAELGFLELLSAAATAPELDVTICSSAEKLTQGLARFSDESVSVQAVIEDPSPVRGELVGVALVQEPVALYAPFAGKGDVLEEGPGALASRWSDPAIAKVGHDVKTLAIALDRHGIALDGVTNDSGCLSHLSDPSNLAPHDLETIAPRLLRRAVPEVDAVRGVGRRRKGWSAIAVDKAARYATLHAEAAAAIAHAEAAVATAKAVLKRNASTSAAPAHRCSRRLCLGDSPGSRPAASRGCTASSISPTTPAKPAAI